MAPIYIANHCLQIKKQVSFSSFVSDLRQIGGFLRVLWFLHQ